MEFQLLFPNFQSVPRFYVFVIQTHSFHKFTKNWR